MDFDKKIMQMVMELAEKAYLEGEVPVASIIVKNKKIISASYNKKEQYKDSTLHAEIIAIKESSKVLDTWRLNGCSLYVNLEPCNMCMGAIINSRIDRLVYGAYDYKMGAINGFFSLSKNIEKLPLEINSGILENKSLNLLQKFFKEKR